PQVRRQFFGSCCLGVLLCLPALAIARPFGIALPTLAFMTAISIAIGEIYTQSQTRSHLLQWQRSTIIGGLILGLVVGIGGGIERSVYVAESLRPNCGKRIVWDGEFLYNLYEHSATIPEQRRKAGLARLERFGITSASDVQRLKRDLQTNADFY